MWMMLFLQVNAIFTGKWDRGSIKYLSCILKCFKISSESTPQTMNSITWHKFLIARKTCFPFYYLGSSGCQYVIKKQLDRNGNGAGHSFPNPHDIFRVYYRDAPLGFGFSRRVSGILSGLHNS
uniref:Uncharacterized protein n=1 Tax=Lactuca sativa TaxID=4236 RepID=A0A9R1V9B0_LACSA|nr:hypothetical protein LSAT_V11C600315680 [Lactuca sativa]